MNIHKGNRLLSLSFGVVSDYKVEKLEFFLFWVQDNKHHFTFLSFGYFKIFLFVFLHLVWFVDQVIQQIQRGGDNSRNVHFFTDSG